MPPLPEDHFPELSHATLTDFMSKSQRLRHQKQEKRNRETAAKAELAYKAREAAVQSGVRHFLMKVAVDTSVEQKEEDKEGEERHSGEENKENANAVAQHRQPRDTICQRDKEVVWISMRTKTSTLRDLAAVLNHKEAALYQTYHRVEKRAKRGEDALQPLAHGAMNPKCRRPRLLSDDQLLWAAQHLVIDNTLHYRDLMGMMQKQFPELEQHNLENGAAVLQHWMHVHLGFRAADFYPLPLSRNLPRIIDARYQYAKMMSTVKRAAYDNAILIDEAPFNVCVLPNKGLSVKGCSPLVPIGKIDLPNISAIVAVNKERMMYFECYDGRVKAQTYADFLRHLFAELQKTGGIPKKGDPKQLIVQDNCAIHKAEIVQSEIPEGIEMCFLPAYSPFLDPCEEVFGTWKWYFTQIVVRTLPQSKENLVDLICKAYRQTTSSEIKGAWGHSLSFFTDSLDRQPVSRRRLLDHVHAGDEKEAAAIRKFRERGLEYAPESTGESTGLREEHEAVIEESDTGEPQPAVATIHAAQQHPGEREDDDDDD
eukprot:ANDGO_04459.mRNA.1 hypothetical protein